MGDAPTRTNSDAAHESSDANLSLPAIWRRRARGATDAQLAACASAFPLVMITALIVTSLRPQWAAHWWPAAAAPMLVGSFGLWGIADRERRAPNARAWRMLEIAALAIACASAAVLVLWFLKQVLGTWTL